MYSKISAGGYVLKNIRNGLILSAALVLGSTAAFAAASIEVNGTCETGPAPCTPGTLAPGGSDSGTFNFNAAVNGDTYNFSGNYLNTLNAAGTVPQENLNLTVTLVSVLGGAATTGVDDINITDLLDSFTFPYTSDDFFVMGTFSFGGALSTTSNAEEYLIVSGTKVGPVGPFHPFGTQTGSITLDNVPTTNPLLLDLEDIMEFGAGSAPGAYIREGLATVPEPAYGIPVGAALIGLGLLRLRRNRNSSSVL